MSTRIIGSIVLAMTVVGVAACGSTTPAVTGTPASVAPTTPVVAATPSATPEPSPSLGTTVGDGEAWIAAQGDGTIRLIRPDGSGDHVPFPLLPGGEQLHPDWSPDGKRLSLTTRGETDEIWIGNVDGTGTSKVVECQAPCQWADEAAWSPDGTSLIFQRMATVDGADVSTLEILDVASGQIRVVLAAPTGRGFYQPRWAPDGKRVVTERDAAGRSDVGQRRSASPSRSSTSPHAKPVATEITDAADLTNSPDWSWVTDTIVFAQPNTPAGFDGPSDLVTMRPTAPSGRPSCPSARAAARRRSRPGRSTERGSSSSSRTARWPRSARTARTRPRPSRPDPAAACTLGTGPRRAPPPASGHRLE